MGTCVRVRIQRTDALSIFVSFSCLPCAYTRYTLQLLWVLSDAWNSTVKWLPSFNDYESNPHAICGRTVKRKNNLHNHKAWPISRYNSEDIGNLFDGQTTLGSCFLDKKCQPMSHQVVPTIRNISHHFTLDTSTQTHVRREGRGSRGGERGLNWQHITIVGALILDHLVTAREVNLSESRWFIWIISQHVW